jgi:hypothetical protein
MGFSLSPTVQVSEIDLTLTVPALATSIAAAVGHFQWGPCEEIRLVDSEKNLVRFFGQPTDEIYGDWFCSANFLAYSNNLKQIRVARNLVVDYTGNGTLAADLTYTATGGTIASAAGDFVADGFKVGDQIVISGSASNDGTYILEAVTTSLLTVVGDLPSDEGTADAPGLFTVGAFNSIGQIVSVPNDGSELTEDTITNDPVYVKNRDDLDQRASNVALTPFYGRFPGVFGNKITVSVFNGARTAQAPGNHWDSWAYKNFFDFAPTNDEIWIVVEYDGDVVETFEGSQDSTSISPLGGTDYFVELINRTSQYIFAVPPATGTGISHQYENGVGTAPYTGTLSAGYTGIVPVEYTQTLANGADSAPIQADYQAGWDLFADPEAEDINFCLQGGAGTTVGKYIRENIADVRLDCVACLSPNESDVVGVPTPALTVQALRDAGNDFAGSSSYAVIDGNYKQQYDKYNDVYRWVPFNGDIAGLMAETDRQRDPWWSPAGLNRGNIKNVFKVAFNPTKAQRDELYRVGINPIAQFQGEGTVLYGDKTAQTKPSAFSYINVRRLFITIEKAIATAARYQLFEFNDEITRNNFINLVEPYLRNVQGRRGIIDFRVVCDETNNTGEVIDRAEFVGDIYVKPNRSINVIQLNFVAVKTGVKFEEVILGNTG